MKYLSFKQKVSVLKGDCQLTERKGNGFWGFTPTKRRTMIKYGVTLQESVAYADSKKWFDKYCK